MDLMFSCYSFWLPSADAAVRRVAKRVLEGGHNIPEEVIRCRYYAGITNLFNIYMDIVDYWVIAENLHNPRVVIAEGDSQSEPIIYNVELFEKMKTYVR